MPEDRASLADLLKSWPLVVLPHHLLSHLVRHATRWQTSWWKNLLIRMFIRRYGVDMQDAIDPSPQHYPDFNSFFTRALKPAARPQPGAAHAISSPVDGRVSQAGSISNGSLIQAKGCAYSLETLLGGDGERCAVFEGGRFATLYLSPRDYHRIHMPCDGRLLQTVYIPGRLYSVAPHTTRAIPGLFTRNERIAALFETSSGPLAVIMVGAIFVACMETAWDGIVKPSPGNRIQTRQFDSPGASIIGFERGDEMGRFNMGSTVILLFGRGQLDWVPELAAGAPLRVGQTIGYRRQ